MFDKLKNIFSSGPTQPKTHTLPLDEIVQRLAEMDIPEGKGACAIVANNDGTEAHMLIRQDDNISVLPLDDEELDGLHAALARLIEARDAR